MEFYAQLKSKKELEADLPRLVSAFIELAEDLLAQEEIEKAQAEKGKTQKPAGRGRPNKKKPLAESPALPLVCDSKKR
ncbi:MAG: hypothetical protein COW32_01265 [Candidatus Aquicultor secundus]|uniref:Uncharacterized protein n=1 Tax=Candidatus Aquicultor secundus TaxID=1973895 RepID=A0A2M7T737_9ACTN|nr:hypothetical protein [Candidatus Aquicultor secundus]OIO88696.1 MAG: hypothetical protein AUK32_00925 [Candidatus Aquicultor secundus]PIW23067.1 MAG: hypothetical protein COW32_01265 [Candidatus Aquicultor secundus]PIZ37465.1 MAG: hypothetical protein COY37_07265 [Candidatus Aquicultor secundus]